MKICVSWVSWNNPVGSLPRQVIGSLPDSVAAGVGCVRSKSELAEKTNIEKKSLSQEER